MLPCPSHKAYRKGMSASSAASHTDAGDMDRAPCEKYSQTAVRSSMSRRWPGNQGEASAQIWTTCATRQPAGHCFSLHVGLHGPGWLYALGIPPRGYFPDFAALNPQSTRHGARPGPKLAPWIEACSCPATESARKDTGAEEQKMPMSKKSSFQT